MTVLLERAFEYRFPSGLRGAHFGTGDRSAAMFFAVSERRSVSVISLIINNLLIDPA